MHWADAATTSFFPAKPLGGYGDGGAVLTDDAALFERMDSLRIHGKAVKSDINGHPLQHDPKYLNHADRHELAARHAAGRDPDREAGVFAEEIELRQDVAAAATHAGLKGHVCATPRVIEGGVVGLGAVRRSSTTTATAWPPT